MKMIMTTMTTIKPQAILTMYKWMTANADSEYGNMALITYHPHPVLLKELRGELLLKLRLLQR